MAKDSEGQILDQYADVKITKGFPYNIYSFDANFSEEELMLADFFIKVIERRLSLNEVVSKLKLSKKFFETFNSEIIQTIESERLLQSLPSMEQYSALKNSLMALFSESFPKIKRNELLAECIIDKSVGFRQIASFLKDESLEEIMVNGFSKPVFIFHKKFAMCKTDVMLTHAELQQLIEKIAFFTGRSFNEENPLLDGRLSDGSRVNATYSFVTPQGHSLTIRKFTKIPLSVIDLIANNTVPAEVAAFMWLMVEGMRIDPKNIIITGGAGSGKTTLLNVLASFIPYSDRVVSIEDTMEIDLGSRENWIQMEARFQKKTANNITMNDLLINSLRMRPDRLVVGEVRGEEAQTLFTAMDTGHKGILGTLHSNSSKEMLIRLKSAPMSVPESMLPLLDLTIVMVKMYDAKIGVIRRIKEVAEIERMEGKVLLSNVFEWNRSIDAVERTDVPSRVLDDLAEKTLMNKRDLKDELLIRKKVLEWMLQKNMRDNRDVEKIIQMYYLNSTALLERVSRDL